VARIAVVSFRLGGTDGVSIEAAKWVMALEQLGHEVTLVAGEGHVDHLIEGLRISAEHSPSRSELQSALNGIDLVIVENLVSLPLNLAARDALYEVLDGRRALFHHHDLPWQREHLAQLEGPRDQPTWNHVTINDLSRRQLASRGIVATTIMNSFDCDPPLGDRRALRERLDIGDQRLLLLPTRVIPRKNVEGAIDLARSLGAVLWILGPAEDGYGPRLERMLDQSGVETRRGLVQSMTVHDAYAACDLVVMSSTWEGFGNPVLESVTHRKPLAVHPYPVLDEIRSYGFDFFDLGDVTSIAEVLSHPDDEHFESNLALAREHFNVTDLPRKLAAVLRLDESDVRELKDSLREAE
jgi:glycosyltransferase involved in cell wall biosynthesis